MDAVAAAKLRMRRSLREHRRARADALSDWERSALAGRLQSALLPLLRRLPSGSTVASFVPLRTEPPVDEVNRLVRALGHRLLLPVRLEDDDLEWQADGDRLGREALAEADLVLVPALAVDEKGMRLGQGGGSYDRALARLGDQVPVLACLHDSEIVREVPVQDHDRAVHGVLTPSGVRVVPSERLPGLLRH